ncbi:uncharacterized protein LOC143518345 [Brachyhypopomus gauderio]|uniref:uncharacterized protein LOC143518345 n=1 Tax=Brachyhypopomus gauderio TaxID=698409 RepID=UPI004043481A
MGPNFENITKQSTKHVSEDYRVTRSPRPHQSVKYISIISGQTHGAHNHLLQKLHKQTPDLQEVSTVEECDVILLFCPIESLARTDIEAALKFITEAVSKPAILVVLHHTFDPYCTVPDSSRSVTRKNTNTVDCLFHEDQGLLDCVKNKEALNSISKWMEVQGLLHCGKNKEALNSISKWMEVQGLLHCGKNKEAPKIISKWTEDQRNRGPNSENIAKESTKHMSEDSRVTRSPHPHQRVKYVSIRSGKTLGAHEHFLQMLHEQIPDLQEVSTVEECDVILLFCPIVSLAGTDIEAALKLITEAGNSEPLHCEHIRYWAHTAPSCLTR